MFEKEHTTVVLQVFLYTDDGNSISFFLSTHKKQLSQAIPMIEQHTRFQWWVYSNAFI